MSAVDPGPVTAGGGATRQATVKRKVLPDPGSLSTPSDPPIKPARRAEMARPSPTPPYRRVAELSACWNDSKMALCFPAGIPIRFG